MTEENQPGRMSRNLFLRVPILFAVLLIALALDAFRPKGDYSLTGVNYDSSSVAPFEIRTPVNFPDHFDLGLDVLANDAANFEDIVQASGPSGPALRLAIDPPGRLVLAPFGIDTVPITLRDTFTLHRWHHLAIRGMNDGSFSVAVDGTVTHFEMSAIQQIQSSAEIGSKDFTFRFGRIQIATGNVGAALNGKIANLSFSSKYVEILPWPVAVLGGALVAAAVLLLLWPWLRCIRLPEPSSSDFVVLAAVAVSTALGFVGAAAGLPEGNWLILLAMGAGTILGVILAARFRTWRLTQNAVVVLSCITIIAAASLLTLPNLIVTARMFGRWPLTSAFCLALAFCVAALALDASARRATPTKARSWLAWIPYALFAILALRTDSVFYPINALHWEYVLGPIRALHEGGWLLWDVPSQYGFLNVLIPAALPIHPAVDAFYWFQAATFFAASAIFYRTLYVVLGMNWLAAGAIVTAFFFLADPLLIGPTPYPSMSAVRFLWCYALLAMAATIFLGERPSVARFVRYGTLPWIVGLLWSAESAIYTTVIFFTPLLASVIFFSQQGTSLRAKARAAVELFALPVAGAVAAFGVVEAIYYIALGHGPDWSMYIAYIRSYGAGFGELPIPFYGPAWAIASILFGGAAAFVMVRREDTEGPAYAVATAMAVVWIVSSYYFGRAFPIVLTMLSPLLVFAVFTIVRAGSTLGKTPVVAVASVPLIALGLVSAFWNANIPTVLPKIARPNVDAWVKLPQADPELSSLLSGARIARTTPVVYYDYWVAMPRAADGPYELNWLPAPLQALDDPIPAAVREKIITRFVERHHTSGYLVQVTGKVNVPVLDAKPWITLLSRYYHVKEVAQSQNYRILQFSLRAPPR